MQRPHDVLEKCDEIIEDQAINLRSALAFAALTTPNISPETKLYENIVAIPHYHNHALKLMDKEDSEDVVEDNFEEF